MENGRHRHGPTITGVNALYLVTMVLLVTLGIAVQRWSVAWGLVITELTVILLPVLVFLRIKRLDLRATLCLRWPGWDLVALSLLIGAGVWFLDVILEGLAAQLLNYPPGTTPETYAMTPLDALGMALGMILLAPLCEEVLFRALIQRGYERLGARRAVLIGGTLFALFHLRFQGLLALLPIALVLGYAFWRSQSLIVPILIHLSNNALGATTLIVRGLDPTFDFSSILLFGAGPAIIVGGLALWRFHRTTRDVVRSRPLSTVAGTAWRWVFLSIAVAIYLGVAGLELTYARFPGILAQDELAWGTAPWREAAEWRYELRLKATDERVGEALCEVAPSGAEVLLRCAIEQAAFEVEQEGSRWIGSDLNQTTTARWSAETLALRAAEVEVETAEGTYVAEVARADGALVLTTDAGDAEILPDDVLLIGGRLAALAGEAPWRLSALPFEVGLVSRATVVEPWRWQPALDRAAPVQREILVRVTGVEPLRLVAGVQIAWRVELGADRTAWYADGPPYPLVRYDSTVLRWVSVDRP